MVVLMGRLRRLSLILVVMVVISLVVLLLLLVVVLVVAVMNLLVERLLVTRTGRGDRNRRLLLLLLVRVAGGRQWLVLRFASLLLIKSRLGCHHVRLLRRLIVCGRLGAIAVLLEAHRGDGGGGG